MESMHLRTDLNCVDWFCEGLTLFDIDGEGRVLVKPFGNQGPFQLLGPPPLQRRMVYLETNRSAWEPKLIYFEKEHFLGGWCSGEEDAKTTIGELAKSTVKCSWQKRDHMFLGLENDINPPPCPLCSPCVFGAEKVRDWGR
eukprot:scaffold4913_cov70-Cylindrotheca_fusiformis.AAC.2